MQAEEQRQARRERPLLRAWTLVLLAMPLVLGPLAEFVHQRIDNPTTDKVDARSQAARAWLEQLHWAQAALRSWACIDDDGDGEAEFGFLSQLVAHANLRCNRSGYRFEVFLPGVSADWVTEQEAGPLHAGVDHELSARAWVAVGRHEDPELPVLTIDQDGELRSLESPCADPAPRR